MKKCKIKSIKKVGIKKTYNLTMQSEQHNYAVSAEQNGHFVISKNSHSACYGFNSYTTAYLKANYPDEFMVSLLDVTINSSVGDRYEKAAAFEKEFTRKMNVKFLPRSINTSKCGYTVVKRADPKRGIAKTEIQPTILCKGLSEKAAKEICKHQPYKDLKDFVSKVDSSAVGVRDIDALLFAGYFGKKNEEEQNKIKNNFLLIKEDMKKIAKKGVESIDMFNMAG